MDPLYRLKRIGLLSALKFGVQLGLLVGAAQALMMLVILFGTSVFLEPSIYRPELSEYADTVMRIGFAAIFHIVAFAIAGIATAALYNTTAEHLGQIHIRLKNTNT